MAWSDVVGKLKFYGPEVYEGSATRLNGTPATVNGIPPSGGAFSTTLNAAGVAFEKAAILNSLEFVYNNSPGARDLLDTGSGDIWLMKTTATGSGSDAGTHIRPLATDAQSVHQNTRTYKNRQR